MSIAVTDENGTSAGPVLKLLSVRGRPHEISITARFGGSTLFEFSETSPELTHAPLWHSAKLALRERYNKLDEFNESSIDSRQPRSACERPSASRPARSFSFTRCAVMKPASRCRLTTSIRSSARAPSPTTTAAIRGSDTSNGWWNSADALWRMGTGGYATLDIDVRRYQRLARQHGVVATSLLTLQSGAPDVVPSYMDFSLGGSNTVRGWGFNARRGKNQFINSLEYRYTAVETRAFRVFGVGLYAGLALAVFGDAGSAWSESATTSRRASSREEASGCEFSCHSST